MDLVPWPNKKRGQKAPDHRDGNAESGSDDGEKGDEYTNSRIGGSEDDEEVHAADTYCEQFNCRNDKSRDAAQRSGESEVDNSESFECAKAVKTTRRKASKCAPKEVAGKRRKAETPHATDRLLEEEGRFAKDLENASRVEDGGSNMDEVDIIVISTSSVKNKTLETKRQAKCAPKHTRDKPRKAEAHNATGRIREEQTRAAKACGNTSLVTDGSSHMDEVAVLEIHASFVKYTLETMSQASCAPRQVAGKRRKAENRYATDRIREEGSRAAKDLGNASQVVDGSSGLDEVEIIEIHTSSVKNKSLETKRKASCASKHAGFKRRKAETPTATVRILE
jgi:hypothetical protein